MNYIVRLCGVRRHRHCNVVDVFVEKGMVAEGDVL